MFDLRIEFEFQLRLYQVNNLSNIVTESLIHFTRLEHFSIHRKEIKRKILGKLFFVARTRKDFSIGEIFQLCSEHGKKFFRLSLFGELCGRNNKSTNRPRAITLRTHCAAKPCNVEGFNAALRCICCVDSAAAIAKMIPRYKFGGRSVRRKQLCYDLFASLREIISSASVHHIDSLARMKAMSSVYE